MKGIPEQLLVKIREAYELDWEGIHGYAHWARVRANGLRLAEATGAKPGVVALFAFLHDVKRQGDGRDPEHGPRAAAFIPSIRHLLTNLSDEDVERLIFACAHHTKGWTKAEVTVQICWDADRLDLGRVGIRPKARLLCTEAARDPAVIEWAWQRSRQERIWGLWEVIWPFNSDR
jgi:uncharacterized protein